MLQFAHFTPRLKWQNANHKTRHSVSLQNKRILVAFTDWSSDRSTGFFSLRLTWPKWHAAHFSSVFDSYLNSYSNSNHCCTVYAGRTDAISWPGKVNWYLIDLTQLTSVITWSTTLPARRPSLNQKPWKGSVPASRTPRGIPDGSYTQPARKVAPDHFRRPLLLLSLGFPPYSYVFVSCLVNFYALLLSLHAVSAVRPKALIRDLITARPPKKVSIINMYGYKIYKFMKTIMYKSKTNTSSLSSSAH